MGAFRTLSVLLLAAHAAGSVEYLGDALVGSGEPGSGSGSGEPGSGSGENPRSMDTAVSVVLTVTDSVTTFDDAKKAAMTSALIDATGMPLDLVDSDVTLDVEPAALPTTNAEGSLLTFTVATFGEKDAKHIQTALKSDMSTAAAASALLGVTATSAPTITIVTSSSGGKMTVIVGVVVALIGACCLGGGIYWYRKRKQARMRGLYEGGLGQPLTFNR